MTMKRIVICFILSLVNLAAIVAVTFRLPETVPIHANYAGVFDSFGPRWVVPLFGLIAPILGACMIVYRKRTQNNGNIRKNRGVEDIVFPLLILLFAALGWLTVAMGFSGPDARLPYELIILIPLGLLMIVLSNFEGVIKQNRWFGIRTKWTLENEEVWRRTHRAAGYSGVVGGLLLIAGAVIAHLTGQMAYAFVGLAAGIVLVALYPLLYSYLIYRRIVSQQTDGPNR